MHRERFVALDGLRGFAAGVVVVFHVMSALTPGFVPDQSSLVPWWADSPLAVFYNGTFAVPVFFVLSGFVLAQASVRRRENLLLDLLLRYVRLALPATFSVLLACLWLHLLPSAAERLNSTHPSPWLHHTYQATIPGWSAAIKDGLWNNFKYGGSRFNNVLWSMRTELIGSCCIYVCFQFVTRLRIPVCALVLAGLLFTSGDSGYFGFGLGAFLFLLYQLGWAPTRFVATGMIGVGLLLGSWSTGFAARFDLVSPSLIWTLGEKTSFWYPIGAALLVAGVNSLPDATVFFRHKFFLFLGRISFPLYLVHVPLIYSVVAWTFLQFPWLFGVRLLAGLVITFALSIPLALVFECVLDRPLIRFLQRCRSIFGALSRR